MTKKVYVSILLILVFQAFLVAQKKPLDKNSYDGWKSLGSQDGYLINE